MAAIISSAALFGYAPFSPFNTVSRLVSMAATALKLSQAAKTGVASALAAWQKPAKSIAKSGIMKNRRTLALWRRQPSAEKRDALLA